MRKAALAALMTASLPFLLSGCAGVPSPDESAAEIQNFFSLADTVTFTADITADYGERVYDYGISYKSGRDGGTVTILSPDEISGICVEYSGDGASVSYDGAEVFTGEIIPDGLSPVDAVPVMEKAWREGLITESVSEKVGGEECIASVFRIEDDIFLRTWFGKESFLPVRAEIVNGGYTVITGTFYDVTAE